MTAYRLPDFDFELPAELVAQVPAAQRADTRLLHVDHADLADRSFRALSSLVRPGDLFVFNDTRVIRARVLGRKPSGGRVELLVERIVGPDEAWAQLRASHLPKPGGSIELPGGAAAVVVERDDRFFRLRFEGTDGLAGWLDRHGAIPLPPYIARAADAVDAARYQTVYARAPGAVAAPTAGLHFDEAMLDALRAAGAHLAWLTLHVGAGTFQPVVHDDLSLHRMHSEWLSVPAETAAAVAATRAAGGRVTAVGTTSLRALESAADRVGLVSAGERETDLFITPGYRFRVVDRLFTNFHLPRSTLLMLVCAFGGYANVRAAYAHAIAARYRFFSYGDAMLVERERAAGPVESPP